MEETNILCGDLCIKESRQKEYDNEKIKYVSPLVTIKRDKLFLKNNPDATCRVHEFRKYKIIKCDGILCTVFDKESNSNIQVRLRNMDSYFYLNDTRRKLMQDALVQNMETY